MTASPADVARRAAVIVQARGLNKGGLYSGNADSGPVCLWGALAVASEAGHPANLIEHPLHGDLHAALMARTGDRCGFPGADFNDDPATTATDVAKLLLQVADDIDAGGAT